MSRREVLESFEKYAEETNRRIEYGIEEYRKGNFRIEVLGKDGKPVENAKLFVRQKTHEFKYGANIFMLDQMETEEKNEKYKKYFAEAFNIATLPFYWSATEPQKGQFRYAKDSEKMYRRPTIDACMEFCAEHGIEPREHGLAYDGMYPNWVKELPSREVKKELSRRMEEISVRYAEKIPTIEVTNETFWWFWEYKHTTRFFNEDGFVEWCFEEARKWFPHNQLVINEGPWVFNVSNRENEAYYMQIQRAIAKGAPIDGIGLQFHMFFEPDIEKKKTEFYYNPRHQYAVLDRYGEFNLPIQITEITVPAYTESEEDEQIQADILRWLYRIWFSQKDVEQIIYWNLVDGYAHNATPGDFSGTVGENRFRGGLLRFDLTPKPAYYMIKNLFEKEWHTETEISTDKEGSACFKGFYGDYEVEVDGKTYLVKAWKDLPTDNEYNKVIRIRLDEEK